MLTRAIRKLLLLILIFAPVSALALTQIAPLTVKRQPHQWQFIFTASNYSKYDFFMLQNPLRFVVDIKNARLRKAISPTMNIDSPVRNIRWARHRNGTLRLVFDLKEKVTGKVFTAGSTNKRRLIVSFQGKRIPVKGFKMPTHHERAETPKKNTSKQTQTIKKPKVSAVPKEYRGVTVAAAPKPVIAVKKRKRSKDIIIVVDPGHGGKDPGATGPGGTHEKTVVLAIGKDLYRIINSQPGFKAYMTRYGNYYLTLYQRLAVARKDKADMFISIHADAFKNSKARGASVFALSQRGATSAAARWLAQRENASELMGGVELNDKSHLLKSVLINLSQTATIRASLKIGKDIIGSLGRIAILHHPRVEQAAFVVLKSPDIPSLLVETGFITNPSDERRLKNPKYQRKLAYAIMKGIKEYFKSHPPRGTLLAEKKYHPKQLARRYKVIQGDSLSRIAQRYDVSLSALRKANRLHGNAIEVGQVLTIPGR